MADISTGRQRGIVPFVDETTGRLPDSYLPQGVIDLQGDLEQAVSDASQSATAAKASETAAKASATAANSSAQAAAASAESAQTATESAASSKDAAARSASEASASAQAAEASKTNAAASASAAETSKTSAAASASAAQASKTNAAASATAAQQAVDGFGLQVGTTTTGEPGSDAEVEIQKTGTKYTANFTIPRGDKGEPASVTHDGTLTGDGTASKPLGAAIGSAVNQTYVFADGAFDLNNLTDFGIFSLNNDKHTIANTPATPFRGCVFVTNNGYQPSNKSSISQVALCRDWAGKVEIYTRALVSGTWQKWERVAFASEVSAVTASVSALEKKTNELAALQTRLQALETRIKSLETNQ